MFLAVADVQSFNSDPADVDVSALVLVNLLLLSSFASSIKLDLDEGMTLKYLSPSLLPVPVSIS